MDIAKIDKNFAIEKVNEKGAVFYDVRNAPFEIYGLYRPKQEAEFKRLPDGIAKSVNPGVANLYLNTAGGRVRFSTNSPYIILFAELIGAHHMVHMPLSGCAGFDLYSDEPSIGTSSYVGSFMPPLNLSEPFKSKIDLKTEKERCFTVNFPSYCGVKNLYIGLKEGATLSEGAKYKSTKPVIYYGSSITQGGCASRSGNSYQNIIARRMGLDYINLGFSGNGRAEDTIVEYMASLDTLAFVSDYDHNAPNPEYLKATHYKMYSAIRAAHPDVPYIMISKPDLYRDYEVNIIRRDIIYESYLKARESGDKNVYFIDGESMFRGPYLDMCTVDGCHPNDLGFALMADVIGDELRRALMQSKLY